MRFANIRAVCQAGAEVNEDSWAASEQFLLAMDGASGLYGVHLLDTDGSDAAWLARRGAEELGCRLERDAAPLEQLSLETAQLLGAEFAALTGGSGAREDLPSAGLSVLRLEGDRLEYYALGDLTILLRMRDGRVEVIHDGAITELDNRVLAEMVRLAREKGETVAQQREAVQPMLRRHRELRNRPGGYRIFDPSAEGADRGLRGSFLAAEVVSAAVLSDGMADGMAVYGMAPDWAAFLTRLETEGPDAVLMQLRQLQAADPDFDRYPRFKAGDDAAAVLAELLP